MDRKYYYISFQKILYILYNRGNQVKIKKILIFILEIILYSLMVNFKKDNIFKYYNNNIKISLCTMGRKENLYIKEFVEYYIKLGIDHIYIYDDNDPYIEKISDALGSKYNHIITIYEDIKDRIKDQVTAYTDCYQNNLNKYDWFLMVDMDEYLYVVNKTLKNYLSNQIFDKCDYLIFHWVIPNDNNLVYYDPRPLFERFRGPYKKSNDYKSIIRGNIKDLKYGVHSPLFSPKKIILCNNEGKILFSKHVDSSHISTKNAYIIHYRFKTTEEFINKYKRGYKNWFGNKINKFLKKLINEFFIFNKITNEKINFIEKELNLNLYKYRKKNK